MRKAQIGQLRSNIRIQYCPIEYSELLIFKKKELKDKLHT